MIVLFSFFLAIFQLTAIKIESMGSGEFFFESITPISYWISIVIIFCVLFYIIPYLDNLKMVAIFVFSSIVLMILIRSVFPLTFTDIIAYEPDATNYLKITNSWLNTSIDFGQSGNYEHDYPLSFLFTYFFCKLGVSVDVFFRFAPFLIYTINFVLLYLIITIVTAKPKVGAIGVFLLSISPLNYWISVHFCPDLFGSFIFLLALFMILRLIKTEKFTFSTVLPVLLIVFLLIITHHLSTLYFIVTLMGIALSTWYFKSSFKGVSLYFLLFGVYTYSLWFVYGTFMYPDFFNVYTYFSQAGSTINLSVQANLFQNFTFIIYPLFIFSLVILYLKKTIGFKKILKFFISPKRFLHPRLLKIELSFFLQYSFGYILVFGLFIVGLAIPSIFAPRVLEILMIGLYPLAATFISNFYSINMSRRKKIVFFIIILFVMLISIHRYYSQIEGRVGAR